MHWTTFSQIFLNIFPRAVHSIGDMGRMGGEEASVLEKLGLEDADATAVFRYKYRNEVPRMLTLQHAPTYISAMCPSDYLVKLKYSLRPG